MVPAARVWVPTSGWLVLRAWRHLSRSSEPHCPGNCACLFFSLELFSPPVLRASPSHSIEGNPVTLKCETSLSPQKSDTQLQFRFFKEKQVLGSGWSSAPELRIPALWAEDSWSYWCQAETMTHNIIKRSRRSQIQVQSECLWGLHFQTQSWGEGDSTRPPPALWGSGHNRRELPALLASLSRVSSGLPSLEHQAPPSKSDNSTY